MPLRHFFVFCQGFATFVGKLHLVPSGGGALISGNGRVRMDLLHLVPAALLCTLGFWFIWPVIVDPIMRRRRAGRARNLDATDSLAEALFEDWADQASMDGVEPSRRG